jgi:hypothetical protein
MTTPSASHFKEPASTGPLRALLRRPALRLVLATLAAGLLSVGAASPATAAETCPNATLREQNNSTELPECRAYEMVSSPYKEGFDLISSTFSDDGIVDYGSTGSFSGNGMDYAVNEYLGVRTPEGWETRSVNEPGTLYDQAVPAQSVFASDLRSSVIGLRPREQSGGESNFYVRDFNGNYTQVGEGPTPQGPAPHAPPFLAGALLVSYASDDLSHIVFGGWEYSGVGNAAVLSQVNLDNNGATVPGESCPDTISGDGRVVVFSTGCQLTAEIPRVWARLGRTVTVLVSGSECTRSPSDPGGTCNGLSPASFAGGAADGSRLFFTTAQQLVNGDTDQTDDLYECDIPPGTPAPVGTANPCASLTAVSGAASGANVENVVRVSEDGSRVYFVADGAVLAGNPGANDETAVAGSHDLYVWTKDAAHPSGTTTFVAGLESNDLAGAQTTSDGRYLIFTTANALVSSGPVADTDGRADLYRYDAETGTMLRLSPSISGSGGNDPGFDVITRGPAPGRSANSISADGSMVVFATAEALSPQDTDGVTDVYLWHDGRVSLISRGGGELPWIDASGQNIYLVTERPLAVADRDVNTDIYDARIDGGFDLSSPAPCSGEACQGQPSTPPASTAAPASETLQGAGNPPQTAPQPAAAKSKPLTHQQKLARALKQCRKQPKHRRLACERQARKRYAPVTRSARRSHR